MAKFDMKMSVAQQLAAQKKASDRADAARRRADKQPAINAYQGKQITAEEYQELVGESYADSMREIYNAQLEEHRIQMATRVQAGFLTPEEFQDITGVEYSADLV